MSYCTENIKNSSWCTWNTQTILFLNFLHLKLEGHTYGVVTLRMTEESEVIHCISGLQLLHMLDKHAEQ